MASDSNSEEKKKTITLMSSDNETFVVEEAVASQSETLKNLIEDGCTDGVIPLANVDSKILAKVVEYCKKHSSSSSEEELKSWDDEFFKSIDEWRNRFDLLNASNYLNIKGLLESLCQAVADLIKDMRVEEVRDIFNVKNDYTPEEELAVRKENAWAFD